MGEHGYTFPGRYDILDRANHTPNWDWKINEVIQKLGNKIDTVVSFGCSVGINEIIFAINNPYKKVSAFDVNPQSINVAKQGRWYLDDIRPSGLGISSSDENLQKLYEEFCPEEYFSIDFDAGILELLKPVKNIDFFVADGCKTPIKDNSVDLVIAHMFAGENCHPYDESYAIFGNEVERLLKPNKFYWESLGLFESTLQGNKNSFKRIFNVDESYALDTKIQPNHFLFPDSIMVPSLR